MKWCFIMSKKQLIKIFNKALKVVKAKNIIRNNIKLKKRTLVINNEKIKLKHIDNLYVFGVGKAAFDMAKEVENILKDKIKGGLIVSTKKGKLKRVNYIKSTHPLVSKKSLKAGKKLINKVQKMKKKDYFIFLLSGGASAMIEMPTKNISFKKYKKLTSSLLTSGISITKLNKTRKSLSAIKGGKLANKIKAKGSVLVLSDVIGDDLNTIGSAPMYNGKFPHNIIANNTIALKAAKSYIKSKVDKVKIITNTLDKSSSNACSYISSFIKEYDNKYDSFCLLFGGETTTKVKANGIGGRNQELALRLLLNNKTNKNISILCAGSDGIDGNSKATGAFVDFHIYKKMKKRNLDAKEYLKRSDSNSFFKALGYDFNIGITGTNVMDFVIILKDKKDV